VRPIVLTIAGSDSSGGAGLQADLKAIEASGGYAATVVTAVTAQGPHGVRRAELLAADLVRAQHAAWARSRQRSAHGRSCPTCWTRSWPRAAASRS
jgi:hydroxymethylpyrimidine/phosphomethylpyrimidine kinase